MVKSLQAPVLYSVPITVLMDMLSTLWNLPTGKACLTALFHRTCSEDLTNLAKQLPWDHPIARRLDREVHRRKMAGKSNRFFGRLELGALPSHLFSCPFFRCLDHPGRPTRVPYLPVGSSSHPRRCLQSLCMNDGRVYHGRFDFRKRDRFLNGRGFSRLCSWRGPHRAELGRLAPESHLSH